MDADIPAPETSEAILSGRAQPDIASALRADLFSTQERVNTRIGPAAVGAKRQIAELSIVSVSTNAPDDTDVTANITYEDLTSDGALLARYSATWSAKVDPRKGSIVAFTTLQNLHRVDIQEPDGAHR